MEEVEGEVEVEVVEVVAEVVEYLEVKPELLQVPPALRQAEVKVGLDQRKAQALAAVAVVIKRSQNIAP